MYVVFDPTNGAVEVYRLVKQAYKEQRPDTRGRFFLKEIGLSLGVWAGSWLNRTGYWLRWWNRKGELVPFGTELAAVVEARAEAERQRAEKEHQRAERERLRAERESLEKERLIELLRSHDISTD